MHERYDAIVIGGGPAGAMAGLLLARRGWRIAIVERGGRNRIKTCGHCLSPRALPILAQAGLLGAVRLCAAGETNRLRVHAPNSSPVEVALEHAGSGLLVERQRFDQLILDGAVDCGADVFQRARWSRASSSHGSSMRIRIHSRAGLCEVSAPLVIGADGLGSGIARAFGAAPSAPGRKFGFSFDLIAEQHARNSRSPTAINMFVAGGGYLGVVEQRGGSIHVAGLIGPGAGSFARDPLAFCRAAAARFGELQGLGLNGVSRGDVVNFTATGPMPWRPQKIASEGFALVGDAAGYVEPFTGEGMAWALQSAQMLAEVAALARPGVWNAHCASRYAALWNDRIGSAQRRCARIAWMLERTWAVAAARWIAAMRPALAQRFAREVIAA